MQNSSIRLSALLATLVLGLECTSCQDVAEPPASASFGQPPTPAPALPVPTASPSDTPAPPPSSLVAMIGGCTAAPVQLTVFALLEEPSSGHHPRFHRWAIRDSRLVAEPAAARLLAVLSDPRTYHPDACMCGETPPRYGVRVSCGSRALDLAVDAFTVTAIEADQEVSINAHARAALLQSFAHALAGGA